MSPTADRLVQMTRSQVPDEELRVLAQEYRDELGEMLDKQHPHDRAAAYGDRLHQDLLNFAGRADHERLANLGDALAEITTRWAEQPQGEFWQRAVSWITNDPDRMAEHDPQVRTSLVDALAGLRPGELAWQLLSEQPDIDVLFTRTGDELAVAVADQSSAGSRILLHSKVESDADRVVRNLGGRTSERLRDTAGQEVIVLSYDPDDLHYFAQRLGADTSVVLHCDDLDAAAALLRSDFEVEALQPAKPQDTGSVRSLADQHGLRTVNPAIFTMDDAREWLFNEAGQQALASNDPDEIRASELGERFAQALQRVAEFDGAVKGGPSRKLEVFDDGFDKLLELIEASGTQPKMETARDLLRSYLAASSLSSAEKLRIVGDRANFIGPDGEPEIPRAWFDRRPATRKALNWAMAEAVRDVVSAVEKPNRTVKQTESVLGTTLFQADKGRAEDLQAVGFDRATKEIAVFSGKDLALFSQDIRTLDLVEAGHGYAWPSYEERGQRRDGQLSENVWRGAGARCGAVGGLLARTFMERAATTHEPTFNAVQVADGRLFGDFQRVAGEVPSIPIRLSPFTRRSELRPVEARMRRGQRLDASRIPQPELYEQGWLSAVAGDALGAAKVAIYRWKNRQEPRQSAQSTGRKPA